MKTENERKKTERKTSPPPSPKFKLWWMPHGYNTKTGAQIGGHADAFRKCVRTDTGEVDYYGVRVDHAWLCQRYRDEFHQWIRNGMPEREYEVDGTAAPIGKQKEVWSKCLKMLLAA